MTSMMHFLASEWDKTQARKHGGDARGLSPDNIIVPSVRFAGSSPKP